MNGKRYSCSGIWSQTAVVSWQRWDFESTRQRVQPGQELCRPPRPHGNSEVVFAAGEEQERKDSRGGDTHGVRSRRGVPCEPSGVWLATPLVVVTSEPVDDLRQVCMRGPDWQGGAIPELPRLGCESPFDRGVVCVRNSSKCIQQ